MATILSRDMSREQRFTRFLETVIFPQLRKDHIYAERVVNRTLDIRGVDATINGALVDIKAHELRTDELPCRYSFERQTRHRIGDAISDVTEVVDGWLVNKRKLTEKYLVCYYTQNCGRISSVTLMLIDRSKVIDFVESRGIDINAPVEELYRASSRVVPQENGSVKYYYADVFDVSLTHSKQLPEEPVNVIIRLDAIKELCDWYYIFDLEVPAEW